MRTRISLICLLTTICCSPTSAASLDGAPGATGGKLGQGLGLRLVGGTGPDQFGVGVQSRIVDLAGGHLAPSLDFAFGDDFRTVSGNADLLWDLRLPGSGASFYAGGGPTLTHWSPTEGDGDLEIGVSLVAGLGLPFGERNRYNLEARIGAGDVPDLRFAFGMLLGR